MKLCPIIFSRKIEKVQMEIEKEVTSSSKPESILSIKTAVLSGET